MASMENTSRIAKSSRPARTEGVSGVHDAGGTIGRRAFIKILLGASLAGGAALLAACENHAPDSSGVDTPNVESGERFDNKISVSGDGDAIFIQGFPDEIPAEGVSVTFEVFASMKDFNAKKPPVRVLRNLMLKPFPAPPIRVPLGDDEVAEATWPNGQHSIFNPPEIDESVLAGGIPDPPEERDEETM